jgi:hypothetical protein
VIAMSYPPDVVAGALTLIREAAPQAAVLHTDYKYSHQRRSTLLRAKLHKSTKHQELELLEEGQLNPGAVKALGVFFGLSTSIAEDMYLAIDRVARLNARGSWCISPANEPTVDGNVAHKPFVSELIDSLQANIPDAGVIQAEIYSQPTPMGHARRRVFLRIFDRAVGEMAALDTSHFAVHIQAVGMGLGSHLQQNLERARFWAEQLGVADVDDMAFVLHDLKGLFADGNLQRVDLINRQVA